MVQLLKTLISLIILAELQLFLLLHRPQDLESPQSDALYRALTRAREAGLASKIGYSIYDPVELTSLMKKYPADVIQAPLNVLDRRLVDRIEKDYKTMLPFVRWLNKSLGYPPAERR